MSFLAPRRPRAMLGCAAALALAPAALPAVAPAATVAQPGTSTSVRQYGGRIVFSQYDRASKRWSLSVRESGAAPRRLDVAPAATPFDADIGTDSKGRPELIYQRCDGYVTKKRGISVSTEPAGCDLYVYSLATTSGERPVSNANDAGKEDVSPTLWNGRIAWTRYYSSGPVVYTKMLSAPRSQPSTRLPGVPERACGERTEGCATTQSRRVEALELWGAHLGMIVRYTCRVCSGISSTEVRLDDVSDRSAMLVASVLTGLAGQHFEGPSFADGQLAFYRGCAYAEPTCRRSSGSYRFKLSKGTYTAATGPIVVTGFADSGSSLYEVLGCFGPIDVSIGGAPLQPTCRIDQAKAPSYKSVAAPIRKTG